MNTKVLEDETALVDLSVQEYAGFYGWLIIFERDFDRGILAEGWK